MATVQIPDEKKYVKAIGLLYEMGGGFSTRPTTLTSRPICGYGTAASPASGLSPTCTPTTCWTPRASSFARA